MFSFQGEIRERTEEGQCLRYSLDKARNKNGETGRHYITAIKDRKVRRPVTVFTLELVLNLFIVFQITVLKHAKILGYLQKRGPHLDFCVIMF